MNVRRLAVASVLLSLPLLNTFAAAQTIPGFTAGNATYSDITVAGDPVNVTPGTDASGNTLLTFTNASAPTWTGDGDMSTITYTVSFAAPIDFVQLAFDGTASGSSFLSARATVAETVSFVGPGNVQYDLPVNGDPDGIDGVYAFGDGSHRLTNFLSLPFPVTTLSIVKSIDISENGGIASIGSVSNTYVPSGGVPSPEPASLGILAAGGAMLLSRRR